MVPITTVLTDVFIVSCSFRKREPRCWLKKCRNKGTDKTYKHFAYKKRAKTHTDPRFCIAASRSSVIMPSLEFIAWKKHVKDGVGGIWAGSGDMVVKTSDFKLMLC
jgi:hypothetical protein